MASNPNKRSEWREIFYLQARIGALFVPIAVGLALIAAVAGSERNSAPQGVDGVVTGSTR